MPLPVAHSLAGIAVFRGLDADGTPFAWKRLLLAVFIANAADLDMIPGILVGEPNLYHHVGYSHSALFAVAVALTVGAATAAAGKRWPTLHARMSAFSGTALMVGLLMLSHVLLDAFNRDFRPPSGVPMFYPLSEGYVDIYPWFVEVAKLGGSGTPVEFVFSLLTVHNLYAIFWEAVTLLPVIALVAWWRSRRGGGGTTAEEKALDEPI